MNALVDYVSYVFLHHAMSTELQQAAQSAASAATGTMAQTQAALYVALTSSEYQVIH